MLYPFKFRLFKRLIYKQQHFFYSKAAGLNLWNEEITSEIKHKIEAYWRPKLSIKPYKENDKTREKYYVLPMFPYPSGFLHMGHVRVYTISDTIARFQRMNGKNVIHPIGWDAFGLPAENAAIERKVAPHEWTQLNIIHMRDQLKQLGCSFEWEREISTCDPKYYKWTQELFLKLYEAGLVYQKEALVNWDPIDRTVLADEQVDENGCSWRSGAKVEKKLLKQWFIRTTQFAKDLLEGLNDSSLYEWRDIIKLQKHWIGDCNGVNFDFKICGNNDIVTLWTSSPEYVKSIKFVAISPNHILAKKENVSQGTHKLQISLENPFTSEAIPVFVTDEIEYLPLTDSYIGIPGFNSEATDFAVKYGICFDNVLIKSDADLICNEARKNRMGGYSTSAKLRDWLISRQRYWGTPIPVIHCNNCGPQPVSREELPVELPILSEVSENGSRQLRELDWARTLCPKCKAPAFRETDTMDTFVDSSWYYWRYLDPHNTTAIFDVEKVKKMAPVDLYIGGKEHVPEREPFKRLLVQGMVMGRSYRVKGTGKYLNEKDVRIIDLKKNKAETKDTKEPVVIAWEKMSKSKHNGVDPQDMFNEYGTDTTRLLILADVAPTSHRNWNTNTFPGVLNWQKRLWLTIRDFINHRNNLPPKIDGPEFQEQDNYLFDSRNYYVRGTTFNYKFTQQLSIAVSKQQGLTNSLRRAKPAIFAYSEQFEKAFAAQIILLAPMAPFFASELWAGFQSAPNRLSDDIDWDKPVCELSWPKVDLNYKTDLTCHINGTEVCSIKIKLQDLEKLTSDEAKNLILQENEVQQFLDGRGIERMNYRYYEGCEGSIELYTERRSNRVKKEAVS